MVPFQRNSPSSHPASSGQMAQQLPFPLLLPCRCGSLLYGLPACPGRRTPGNAPLVCNSRRCGQVSRTCNTACCDLASALGLYVPLFQVLEALERSPLQCFNTGVYPPNAKLLRRDQSVGRGEWAAHPDRAYASVDLIDPTLTMAGSHSPAETTARRTSPSSIASVRSLILISAVGQGR